MTLDEVMLKLEALGSEQIKNIYLKHGAREPYFGIKIAELKKLVKDVKKDQELALALYNTGNSDAMYLAGLSVNPKLMTKEQLQEWVKQAYWYMLAEYTVAWVTSESEYALELAKEWMDSEEELIATCGWSTYASYLSITPDEQLNLPEIQSLLDQIANTVHKERNRVKYSMNGFVIAVGTYVVALNDEAKNVAKLIGKVHVNVGDTACKVPLATDYIKKVEDRDKVGKKRKHAIC